MLLLLALKCFYKEKSVDYCLKNCTIGAKIVQITIFCTNFIYESVDKSVRQNLSEHKVQTNNF